MFPPGGLIQLSPKPPSNSIITAQSGDVVGYCTKSQSGVNEGIQLGRGVNYTVNRVWYRDFRNISSLMSDIISIGSEGILNFSLLAAPMLRIYTSKILVLLQLLKLAIRYRKETNCI